MSNFLTSAQVLDYTKESGVKKAKLPIKSTILLSFLAGLFIALAAVGSNIIAHNIDDIGLAKYLAGLIFPAGLVFVVIAGAELFTGNNLISVAVLSKKVSLKKYFTNLSIVWLGNLVGSIFISLLIFYSGHLEYTSGLLGAYTIKVGVVKTNLSFLNLFTSGILCNILVCLAVWMSYAAKDISGKVLVIFFPIWLFIASGYEHSVANMYYISAAMLAALDSNFVLLAQSHFNITNEALSNLSLYGMFIKNLIPVTIGNLVGGGFFVGTWYWWSYRNSTNC